MSHSISSSSRHRGLCGRLSGRRKKERKKEKGQKRKGKRKGTKRMGTPIDMAAWEGHIHDQAASPLYNGRIPPEIRTAIFEFVLGESYLPHHFSSHDFRFRNDHDCR